MIVNIAMQPDIQKSDTFLVTHQKNGGYAMIAYVYSILMLVMPLVPDNDFVEKNIIYKYSE